MNFTDSMMSISTVALFAYILYFRPAWFHVFISSLACFFVTQGLFLAFKPDSLFFNSPVFVMLIYGIILVSSLSLSVHLQLKDREVAIYSQEESTDSPYFLGFVFTLISLIFTFSGHLSSYGQPERAAIQGEIDTNIAIIAQNAVALSSTVAGLVFRSILRYRWPIIDPASMNESIMLQLKSLETNLEGIQRLTRGLSEEYTSLANSLDGSKGTIQRATQMTTRMGRVASLADERIAKLGKSHDAVHAALKETATKHEEFLKQFNDSQKATMQEYSEMQNEMKSNFSTYKKEFDNINSAIIKLAVWIVRQMKKFTG